MIRLADLPKNEIQPRGDTNTNRVSASRNISTVRVVCRERRVVGIECDRPGLLRADGRSDESASARQRQLLCRQRRTRIGSSQLFRFRSRLGVRHDRVGSIAPAQPERRLQQRHGKRNLSDQRRRHRHRATDCRYGEFCEPGAEIVRAHGAGLHRLAQRPAVRRLRATQATLTSPIKISTWIRGSGIAAAAGPRAAVRP